eukprot:TRINITY_DN252_c0_g1_i3.p1 TRINITY_DN252_c0_g1~~TRINITY_DN252_c0_g1_i3.p1  ORF type:complete len:531 (-),score=65.54 TRINITY_DN252_c0_g1_i3:2768-4360(-)
MKPLAQFPPEIACPITREPMERPMIAADGFTYEKHAIKKWLKKRTGSPMLGTELKNNHLLENNTLSAFMTVFKGMKSRLINRPVPKTSPKKPLVAEHLTLPGPVKRMFDEALNHYYMATKDLKDCCKMMQDVYHLAPTNFDVIFNYANILRFSMDFERAKGLIKELKVLRPESLIPKYMKVRVLSEMGKKEKAIECLEKTLSHNWIADQTLLEVRFMSYSYLSTDNKGIAESFIDAYLSLIPNDPRALSHRIYIDLLNENYQKVIDTSKGYLKDNRNDVSILFHMAKAYTKLDKKEDAKNVYGQIKRISLDKTVKAKALYELAVLRDCNAEFHKMVEELEESNKLDPQEEADGYLAALYADKKMFKEAEEWLAHCEKRTKIEADSVYLGIRAQIQEHKKEYEAAVQSYIMLAEIDAANAEYYNHKIEELLAKQANSDSMESDSGSEAEEEVAGNQPNYSMSFQYIRFNTVLLALSMALAMTNFDEQLFKYTLFRIHASRPLFHSFLKLFHLQRLAYYLQQVLNIVERIRI